MKKLIILLTLITACSKKPTTQSEPPPPTIPELQDDQPPIEFTASLGICWDRNPEPDIAKYKIYHSLHENPYVTHDSIIEVLSPMNRHTLPVVSINETHHFQVTAVNTAGLESEPSTGLTWHMPVMAMPKVLRLLGIPYYTFQFSRARDRANIHYLVEWTDRFAREPEPTIWNLSEDAAEVIVDTIDGIENVRVQLPLTGPMRFYRVRLDIEQVGCAVPPPMPPMPPGAA